MRSAAIYGIGGGICAVLTALLFATYGVRSYMFLLFGGLLSIVLLGIAYDSYRLDAVAGA